MIYFVLFLTLSASLFALNKSKNKIIVGASNIVALLSMSLLIASVMPESCMKQDCGQEYDKQGSYNSC